MVIINDAAFSQRAVAWQAKFNPVGHKDLSDTKICKLTCDLKVIIRILLPILICGWPKWSAEIQFWWSLLGYHNSTETEGNTLILKSFKYHPYLLSIFINIFKFKINYILLINIVAASLFLPTRISG